MSMGIRLFLGIPKLTRGQTVETKQLPLPLQSLAANSCSGRSGPSDFLPIHATRLMGIMLCRYNCSVLTRAAAMHSPEPKKYSFPQSSFYVSSALFLCCFLAFKGLMQMSHEGWEINSHLFSTLWSVISLCFYTAHYGKLFWPRLRASLIYGCNKYLEGQIKHVHLAKQYCWFLLGTYAIQSHGLLTRFAIPDLKPVTMLLVTPIIFMPLF